MIPLAILAVYLYYAAFEILFRVGEWNKICADPKRFECAYGDFLQKNYEPKKSGNSASALKENFSHLRITMLSGVNRRLICLKLLCTVAPLLGLLGTVSGMNLGFSSAATAYSGVAAGVSQALITTQAGLVIAIPAWILSLFAGAKIQKLLVNLSAMESAMIRREFTL